MNEWQTYCLALMDIERWISRPSPTVARNLCILIADEKTLPLSVRAQQLLSAILKWLGVNREQCCFIESMHQVMMPSTVLMFGGQVELQEHQALNHHIVVLDGLNEMLAQPIKKKQVYNILRSKFNCPQA